MSDMKRGERRSGGTNRESQVPIHETMRQLELHAIEEQFLSDWRAGLLPQLSAYLRRYPDYSSELAAFVAHTFVPENQSGVLLLIDNVPSHEHWGVLSFGTRRALDLIFGTDTGAAESFQMRVAERRAGYMNDVAPTIQTEDQSE